MWRLLIGIDCSRLKRCTFSPFYQTRERSKKKTHTQLTSTHSPHFAQQYSRLAKQFNRFFSYIFASTFNSLFSRSLSSAIQLPYMIWYGLVFFSLFAVLVYDYYYFSSIFILLFFSSRVYVCVCVCELRILQLFLMFLLLLLLLPSFFFLLVIFFYILRIKQGSFYA